MEIIVSVKPASKKNIIIETKPSHFEVSLKAKPEHGEANEALRQLLAEYFQTSISNIQILTGRQSRHKRIDIRY